MSTGIFLNKILQEFTNYLCWIIQRKMRVLEGIKLKFIIFLKILSGIVTLPATEHLVLPHLF